MRSLNSLIEGRKYYLISLSVNQTSVQTLYELSTTLKRFNSLNFEFSFMDDSLLIALQMVDCRSFFVVDFSFVLELDQLSELDPLLEINVY